MSEHIQPALDPYHVPVAQTPERTPGVLHEKEDVNFRLILWVGFGLVVTAVVVHLVVWWLLIHEEKRNIPPSGGQSSLMLTDARRPLEQRLLDVPPPLLEGLVKIEPRSIEAAREWAEVQMNRYGWADRQKGVVRIPVATAMEEILRSQNFPKKVKSESNIRLPSRSNSGQSAGGDKP